MLCSILRANQAIYLWPVKDAKIGQNILFKPQTYIENELNHDAMVIGGAFGSVVVSPADGILDSYLYTYNNALDVSTSFRVIHTNYKENIAYILKENANLRDYSQYIGVSAGIRLKDGKMLYIQGLRPLKNKKTGQVIKQGDTIGTIGFFYKKITSPCIAISISERGKLINPMSLFGLQSNFTAYTGKTMDGLTKKQVQEDYLLFFETLEDCYPGIYDYNTPEEIERIFTMDMISIDSIVSMQEFRLLMAKTIRKLGDCHLQPKGSLFPMSGNSHNPSVAVGYLNDSLIITRTLTTQTQYLGKRVSHVDGISADSLKSILTRYMLGWEGHVQSYPQMHLLTDAFLKYFTYASDASPLRDMKLTFENGESVFFPGKPISAKTCVPLRPNWMEFALINKQLSCKILMPGLAYMGLPSFGLKETEMDKIRVFIKEIKTLDSLSLIIDVRNNNGGESDRVLELFSYIAQDTFSPYLYAKVNKKEKYNFEHTLNYAGITDDIFPEYDSMDGAKGFYLFPQNIHPFTDTNFKKTKAFTPRIYVLTNEHTFSAATEFAILVRKYRRGIIIGRETGSNASFTNASKFLDLRLPNSGIVIQIPLVKTVYDEVSKTDSLYGRGVIPDYTIPISIEELSNSKGDIILKYAEYLFIKQ